MQKVMLVGMFSSDSAQYTYASSFARTFYNLGFRVITFNSRYQFFPWLPLRFTSRLNNFLINQSLLKQVKEYQPDLVFLIKAENIFASTLKKIKEKYNPTIINFYPDNPFVLWNGNSTHHVLMSLPIFDHFLIWSEMLIPVLYTAGCKSVYYFPLAFEEELFNQIPEEVEPDYQSQVCFIGTWEPARQSWLTLLCQRLPELKLALWGDLWLENIHPEHVLRNKIRGPALYEKNMIKALHGADIVLNFIREQNATAHNMRTFEVPAAKSFMLTQRTKEQAEKLFIENESIVCFSNIDELIEKITWYLQHPDQRKKIAQKGYNAVQQYTLHKQLEKFLLMVKKEKGSHHEFTKL